MTTRQRKNDNSQKERSRIFKQPTRSHRSGQPITVMAYSMKPRGDVKRIMADRRDRLQFSVTANSRLLTINISMK